MIRSNSYKMATNLNRLAYLLKRNDLIPEQTRRILQTSANNVLTSPENEWELVVYPENPIEFKIAESDNRIKPDLFCDLRASNDDSFPLSYLRLVIRAWSIQRNISYRPGLDSEEILRRIERADTDNRVISRCHFDTCDSGQYAPYYHFQLHGDPEDNEIYWYPNTIELPRFPSPPLDLILACEIIVATFFPTKHRLLVEQGEWTKLIKESECYLLSNYFRKVVEYLDNCDFHDKTLLHRLCAQPE